MSLPRSIEKVIEGFESLPGIGPKTAQRLAMHMLRIPDESIQRFADSLARLNQDTKICKDCFNVAEEEICKICSDFLRDRSIICVVENPMDLLAIEKSDYNGLYHVLHGLISPMHGIGPDEIYLKELFDRINFPPAGEVTEIILAINTTLEGEATAMYIKEYLKKSPNNVQLSRIGIGLPIGATVEYADQNTLKNALNSRVKF